MWGFRSAFSFEHYLGLSSGKAGNSQSILTVLIDETSSGSIHRASTSVAGASFVAQLGVAGARGPSIYL